MPAVVVSGHLKGQRARTALFPPSPVLLREAVRLIGQQDDVGSARNHLIDCQGGVLATAGHPRRGIAARQHTDTRNVRAGTGCHPGVLPDEVHIGESRDRNRASLLEPLLDLPAHAVRLSLHAAEGSKVTKKRWNIIDSPGLCDVDRVLCR